MSSIFSEPLFLAVGKGATHLPLHMSEKLSDIKHRKIPYLKKKKKEKKEPYVCDITFPINNDSFIVRYLLV
jgi:hypothetical protein